MHNQRHVVAVYDPSVELAATLANVDHFVRQTADKILRYCATGTAGLVYRFHPQLRGDRSQPIDIPGMVKAIYGREDAAEPLRLLLDIGGAPVNGQLPLPPKNFILVAPADGGAGWTAAGGCGASVRVGTDTSRSAYLVHDLLLDMVLANAHPLKPILDRASQELGGLAALYQRKVNFLIKTERTNTIYGQLNSDAGYVSFAAASRRSFTGPNQRHGSATVALWDEFVATELSEFCPKGNALLKLLCDLPGIGGQLSPRGLAGKIAKLSGGGAFLIARVGKKPDENIRKRQAAVVAKLGIPSWNRSHVVIMPANDLDDELRRYAADGHVALTKFYLV